MGKIHQASMPHAPRFYNWLRYKLTISVMLVFTAYKTLFTDDTAFINAEKEQLMNIEEPNSRNLLRLNTKGYQFTIDE